MTTTDKHLFLDHIELENPIVLPQGPARGFHKGLRTFAFGPLETDPKFVHHFRGSKLITNLTELFDIKIENLVEVRGRRFYGGPIDFHFGHFISECLGRLWFWEVSGRNRMVWCPTWQNSAFSWTKHLPQWQIDIFNYCGLDVSTFDFIEAPTRVSALVVAQQGSSLYAKPHAEYISWLEERQKKFMEGRTITTSRLRKVFVSRGELGFDGRRIVGVEDIIEKLVRAGYKVVHPEKMSIEAQLIIYLQADKLIFEAGSSVHLLELLAHIDGRVAILPRARIGQAHTGSGQGFCRALAPRSRNQIWTYSGQLWMDESDLLLPDSSRRTFVEIAQVLDELKDAGFL